MRGRGRSAAVVAAVAGLSLLVVLLLARVLAVDGDRAREFAASPAQSGFGRAPRPEAAAEETKTAPAPLPELPPLGDRAIPRDRSIRGRAVDASGAVVPDAVVAAARKNLSAYPHVVERIGPVRTDADGTFVLGPVEPARPYAVLARKEGAGVAAARDAVAGAWVDLVLLGGARIEGRVTQRASGEPVEGARVFLRDHPLSGEARTDAEGRYVLDALPPTPNAWWGETLVAVADALRRGERSSLSLRAGESVRVDFALDAGATLQGVVRDERTGQPLSGAIVEEGWEPWHRRAVADAEGAYRLAHVEVAPNLLFYARAERYRTASAQSDGSGALDFALEPAATLCARVFAPDGTPAAGARVYLLAAQRPADDGMLVPSGFTPGGREPRSSDADGRVEFPDVGPGQVVLVAFHADFAPAETPPIVVSSDGAPAEEVRVELKRGFSVSGVVVDEKDRPIPDVAVRAHPQEASGEGGYRNLWRVIGFEGAVAYTDAAGRFEIRAAIPSRQVWLYAGRIELGWAGVTIEAKDGQRIRDVRISFAGAKIGGVVLDAEGRPVPGVSLQAQGPEGSPSARWRWVQTDALGRFVFGGLEEGSYTLGGGTPFGGLPQRQGVATGTMDVELRLSKLQPLRGVVRSAATRAPIERFTVAIAPKPSVDARGRTWGSGSRWQGEMRAPDGTFERSVAPGVYVVTVRAPGHAPLALDGVAVEEHVAPQPLEFALQRGASLHGTLRDAQGRPVPSVNVALRRDRPKELGPPPPGEAAEQLRDLTDAKGRYVFDGVAAGSYVLTAMLGERGSATARVVVPGTDDVRADLELLPTGQIRFVVKDEEGNPVQGIGFYLQDENGNWVGWAYVTDATGAVTSGPVREGPAKAFAWQPEPPKYAIEALQVRVLSQRTVEYEIVAKKREG